ncbi:MAG: class I SAM-dependent methyltransferase, partial [Pseudomonadota bacterium]
MNEHTSPLSYDAEAAEKFSDKVAGMLNDSAVVLMLSVGHRTGLFATMSALSPSTSEVIAEASELDERYVREWLAAMTTGGLVDYDPKAKTFQLPPEHAASLTAEGALGNLAVYAQFIAMSGAVQDTIIDRFKNGGGVAYADYPHFHEIMAEDSGQTVVAQLFDTILPLAEGMTQRLEAGIDVLDAGCGAGKALIAMAGQFPKSRFVGYDLSSEAIGRASQTASALGLDNIEFGARDLTGFDEVARYDLITSFDAVHDQKDPQGVLQRLALALRPGG